MTKAFAGIRPLIFGDGNQFRDFIYVKDVIKANLVAANGSKAPGEICNIGTGKYVSVNDLWKMICRLAESDIEPIYESSRDGDIRESAANIDHARKILGFEPEYTFEKGLKETFEYYSTANKHK